MSAQPSPCGPMATPSSNSSTTSDRPIRRVASPMSGATTAAASTNNIGGMWISIVKVQSTRNAMKKPIGSRTLHAAIASGAAYRAISSTITVPQNANSTLPKA